MPEGVPEGVPDGVPVGRCLPQEDAVPAAGFRSVRLGSDVISPGRILFHCSFYLKKNSIPPFSIIYLMIFLCTKKNAAEGRERKHVRRPLRRLFDDLFCG